MKKEFISIIPARGGSKEIPHKNIKEINGKPLIQWTIESAKQSQNLKNIYVSTDSNEISDMCENLGVRVIKRPPEISTDDSQSEDALIHVLENIDYKPYAVVFLQCTSPIRKDNDIDDAIEYFLDSEFDSMFSCILDDRFMWCVNENNKPKSINYDYSNRKMRQHFSGKLLKENGSLYITKTQLLIDKRCRLVDNIGYYVMNKESDIEIDDELDFYLVEKLLERKYGKTGFTKLQRQL